MKYQKFLYFIQNVGKDPSALIFEDYLTGLNNRRFLLHYLKHNIDWNDLEQHPVSLLMIDIDYFKRINEEYGHTVGDQVLIHIAGILKTISRKKGIPSLYAGDIFMLLLPGLKRPDAVKTAAELFYQLSNNLFFSADAGTEIPITVSIGTATAPDDANSGEDLVNQAKNALYHAKQAGRNRYADASLVSRQAVHYLENAGIVGRKIQFDQVGAALKKFAEGQSQFVLVDGGPGMGKTSFLYTIQRNLEKTKLNTIRIAGISQESYRPYYLVSNIVIKLMNQLEDKGIGILESMNEKDAVSLAQIIPQLEITPVPMPQDDAEYRNLIFTSFTRFFAILVGNRPLALLLDDLHYTDPASLHLLKALIQSKSVRLFICGTASQEKQAKAESLPLDLFRSAYAGELGIQFISLGPLGVEDIDKFLNMTFPGIDMPSRLTKELADLAQGNPLFIMEILRKMISDQRIIQSGRQWKMARLEKRYFPKSLEEIFKLKMDLLDDESKRFLECAAAFGESISLSMLTGSYNEKSSKIHDFVNRGVAQGIVQSDFEENDENIRFSSKSIREAIYERIESDQKKNLHEEIGSYHEKLYKQDLLPSASILAYHFKRSGDSKKATAYSQLQEDKNRKVFNKQEAGEYKYTDDETEDKLKAGAEELGDVPLGAEGTGYVPKLFRSLLVVVRNIRLYPIDSKSVAGALEQMKEVIDQILKGVERFSIITEKQNVLINGVQLEIKEYQTIAEKIIEFWDRLQLKSLTFLKGFDESELKMVLETFSRLEQKEIAPQFWKKFIEEKKLTHIFPRQIKYKKIETPSDQTADVYPALEENILLTVPELASSHGQHIDDSGLKLIQKVVSALLGTYSKLKLYPDNNPVATEAVNLLISELKQYFSIHPVLSIARVEKSLLVNGAKVDTSGFETLAKGLLRFFKESRLNSITFLKQASFKDLLEFITASIQAPPVETDPMFWPNKVKEKQINGILLNQQIYGIIDERAGGPMAETKTNEQNKPPAAETRIDDKDLQKLPDLLRERFLTGDTQGIQSILEQVCTKYSASDDAGRKMITNVFEAVLQPGEWRPGAAFIKLVLTPLIPLFTGETNPEILNQSSTLVHQCAAAFVLFGEYALAAWTYGCLKKISATGRLKSQDASGNLILPDKVDIKIFLAVIDDLKSEDRGRQQEAYQLLSSMGQMIVPQLIDAIKREDNLRIRQLAAELIKNSGPAGIDLLKKSLLGENRPDDRARMLDVIDSVTKNLLAELTDTLSDNRDVVRKAAFRLAERLNTPEACQMLIEFSKSDDSNLAAYSINSLGKLKPPAAKDTILKILEKSGIPDVLTASCRAAAQIGDPSFIPILGKILTKRRAFGGRKYDSQARVAAASALSQIPNPQAQKALSAAAKDPDYRVRETVKQAMARK